MNRVILLGIFYTLIWMVPCQSQVDTIRLNNPSFEDYPRTGKLSLFGRPTTSPPLGWYDCSRIYFPDETPPDVHPHPKGMSFSVTKGPSHGKTYLGMVARDNDSHESVSQRLSSALKAGNCYEMYIDLCKSPTYLSPWNSADSAQKKNAKQYTKPIVLRVYGGSGVCNIGTALAESEAVKNTDWERYRLEFRPHKSVRHLTLSVYYKTPILDPYNGNILLDNISEIVQIPCPGEEPFAVVEGKQKSKYVPLHKKKKPKKKKVVEKSKNILNEEKPVTTKILTDLDRGTLTQGQIIRIDKLYFEADKSSVNENSQEVLNEIYSFLHENHDIVVEIGGHTNGRPKHEFCDRLSTERAKAVAEYLAKKGIGPSRLKYKGYGKRKPIAPNGRAAGRKMNQRVEIKILSFDS